MARDWRRAVMAALAALMLGSVCVLAARALAAEEEPNGEQAGEAPGASKGARKRQDPAEAQRAIESALKQLQAGRAEQAAQSMTAVLSGGNLPPAIMAKALYVRGMAYRQQRRPAQAVSDLTGALWLPGGLGVEEREDAERERAAAYADAGVRNASAVRAPAPKKAGSWLSSLFGSPAAPPPEPAPPAPAPPALASTAAAPSAISSPWSTTSRPQPERPAVAAASAPPPPRAEAPRAPPPAARPEGRYQVQLAAVRTEAEAHKLVSKAKREPALASREPWIDHTVIGNMGAFYRVRFGPFASAQETEAVCAKLQGSGFDCMPVGP
jgi:cell division septation protein DedD